MSTEQTGNKIIDRIRKLLELSKSANEHEAASAGARAAALMEEHQISEAVLRVTDEREAEPVVEGSVAAGRQSGRRVAWKCTIVRGAAKAMGCSNTFTTGGKMSTFGHTSAVQTWSYLCQYLFREVDRLADEAWETQRLRFASHDAAGPRAWKNAFRLGAAHVICERLKKQAKRQDDHRAAAVAAVAPVEATMALAIIAKDRALVDAEYARRAESFVKGTPIGQISSGDGYRAGRKAGETVALSGGGPGLPAPAKALRRS
jgi:hypothetical protein